MTNRILTSASAAKISGDLRKDGKKIILVGGCFDILHNGHVRFLRNAKKLGDVLLVLLESDASISKSKGSGRPINPQIDRAEILSELRDVDYVILLPSIMTDEEYDNVIIKIKPAIIATTKGDPWKVHKERQATLVGGKVTDVISPVKNKSTTRVAALLTKEL